MCVYLLGVGVCMCVCVFNLVVDDASFIDLYLYEIAVGKIAANLA